MTIYRRRLLRPHPLLQTSAGSPIRTGSHSSGGWWPPWLPQRKASTRPATCGGGGGLSVRRKTAHQRADCDYPAPRTGQTRRCRQLTNAVRTAAAGRHRRRRALHPAAMDIVGVVGPVLFGPLLHAAAAAAAVLKLLRRCSAPPQQHRRQIDPARRRPSGSWKKALRALTSRKASASLEPISSTSDPSRSSVSATPCRPTRALLSSMMSSHSSLSLIRMP